MPLFVVLLRLARITVLNDRSAHASVAEAKAYAMAIVRAYHALLSQQRYACVLGGKLLAANASYLAFL